ncbi:MAG TPA: flagellar basal body P-ring formation chaperone FlgA [Terriglobia bacterium]|nr:flagellar basal body P-ring formation chaperone FlgA [Terriglobia bacterium]
MKRFMPNCFHSQVLRSLLLAQALVAVVLHSEVGFGGNAVQPKILGRADLVVRGRVIYLGDLLQTELLKPEIKEQFNSITVSPAPPAGKSKTLPGIDVIQKLESLGITTRDYSIQMPEDIKVSRSSRTLRTDDLENAVAREFLPKLPWREVRLENLEVPEALQVPQGENQFSCEYSPHTDLARPFYLAVTVSVDGELIKRLFLRTTLSIEETVAIATRELPPGQSIEPEEIRWEKRRLSSTLHLPILEMGFLEGKKPRTTIPAGEVLTEDLLIKVPLIKRGDTITLVFQDERIRVKTQGKSLASGMRGDQIQVMNLDSKKVLRAEVLDKNTAQVSF